MHTFFEVNHSITSVKGVGEKTAEKLMSIGIHTIDECIFHLPSGYEDFSLIDLNLAEHNEKVTVYGVIKSQPTVAFFQRGKSKLSMYMNINGIHTKVIFFNQHYLKDKLEMGESVKIVGKFDRHKLEIIGQKVINSNKDTIEPKYTLSRIMHSKTFSKIIESIFINFNFKYALPKEIIEKYQLMPLKDAIYQMHFPSSSQNLKGAIRTVKFYELYHFQLKILEKRKHERQHNTRFIVDYNNDALKTFIRTLPFELTQDQKNVVNEICADLKQSISMHRLLQGDVGSGKTIVAGIAIYATKTTNGQSAIMVPTEVLANQHYESFKSTFNNFLRIEKLTGSTTKKEKARILDDLKKGEINLLIGTHALIEDDVEFKNLSLIIIDEQHRFGVNQRKKLELKAYKKNILYMTATPIPRTLSITSYGDMDVSVIKEMPKGRKPVITEWYKFEDEEIVHQKLKAELKQRHSIYVIAPLIEESLELDLNNVYDIYHDYVQIYGEDEVSLVHGQMKQDEKNDQMALFENLQKKILISTTVIEVGINVPNATFMVIYNAERFGLSTLHQLRGRVGRSATQSYCILLSDPKTENAIERLHIMTDTTDGFVLSERDLQLRGPGDYFGVRQSGLPMFKVASITEDYKMLEHARLSAIQMLKDGNN